MTRRRPDPVVLRQPAQRGVQDVGGLDLGQLELLHQAVLGGLGVLAGPDQLDHPVDVEQGDQQALDEVQPLLALAAAELRAAGDDLVAVAQEDLEQRLRVDAHLALDDQPRAVLAVGEVLDVGDAGEPLGLVDLVGDLLDHLLRADAVGQLGDAITFSGPTP